MRRDLTSVSIQESREEERRRQSTRDRHRQSSAGTTSAAAVDTRRQCLLTRTKCRAPTSERWLISCCSSSVVKKACGNRKDVAQTHTDARILSRDVHDSHSHSQLGYTLSA